MRKTHEANVLLFRDAAQEVLQKAPVPVTTVIQLRTKQRARMETRLGDDVNSIQFAKNSDIVEMPVGSQTRIIVGGQYFIVDDMRQRPTHEPGVRIRTKDYLSMLYPPKTTKRIQGLGKIIFHPTEKTISVSEFVQKLRRKKLKTAA